jgi:phage terminase small subunit
MPALPNARQERFAQELAKGKTAGDAYAAAGYKPNPRNADRFKKNQEIMSRVAEIMERGAVRAEISRANVLSRLDAAAKRAGEMKGPAAVQAERGALMDIAKLEGWIIDKSETGAPGEFARMTDAQLRDFIAAGITRHRSGDEGDDRPRRPPLAH